VRQDGAFGDIELLSLGEWTDEEIAELEFE
jgi:hypothetical protein